MSSIMVPDMQSSVNDEETTLKSSDDESSTPVFITKKRLQRFSDSSDSDVPKKRDGKSTHSEVKDSENSDNEVANVIKSGTTKSRLRKVSSSDDEDSEKLPNQPSNDGDSSDSGGLNSISDRGTYKSCFTVASDNDSSSEDNTSQIPSKNEGQQLRMKNKKNKLKNKFKSLLNSREKNSDIKHHIEESTNKYIGSEDSDDSYDDISSIDKIKQKIKERSASFKMTICDPDTSVEESSLNKISFKPKKDQKRTKLTSPKPQRMSAKQAMENMQKIKSESNRMLREKEVSLPYHRPKALSLQDIMKRRKPAVSSDGKSLPIKMNEEQLKQYVQQLEERQKEIMELCKSESDEEEDAEHNDLENETAANSLGKVEENGEIAKENVSSVDELSNKTVAQMESKIDSIVMNDNANSNITEIDNPSEAQANCETPGEEGKSEEDNQNKSDLSAELVLVYNDSIEDDNEPDDDKNVETVNNEDEEKKDELESISSIQTNNLSEDVNVATNIENNAKHSESTMQNTEIDSQLISLQFDSENTESVIDKQDVVAKVTSNEVCEDHNSAIEPDIEDFPDDDINMSDIDMDNIDSIIENTEIDKNSDSTEAMDSPALVRDIPILNVKPKLTGAPGSVIDLDGSDAVAPKKTGVELLKERFTFFAKLKTPEELEREREKRQKPGTQHLKLKQQLEDIIAEQRSLEWSKRLENEKQQQMEMDAVRGDGSDVEDDIDNIEAKLNDNDVEKESSLESEEEDLVEDDVLMEDKPKKRNPLLADEAEESEIDDEINDKNKNHDDNDAEDENDDGVADDDEITDDSEDETSEEESSESEDEKAKPRKGRILKAFEDSDDEDTPKLEENDKTPQFNKEENSDDAIADKLTQSQNYGIIDSQDDVIQLAQIPKQMSSDVFTSQGSALNTSQNSSKEEESLSTQTFSILESSRTVKDINDPDKLTIISDDAERPLVSDDLEKLAIISETQTFNDDNLDAVVGMCSGNFQTQNCIQIEPPTTQISQSQVMGEDVLDMCTGKFYDNEFVSPSKDQLNTSDEITQHSNPASQMIVDSKEKPELNEEMAEESKETLKESEQIPKENKEILGKVNSTDKKHQKVNGDDILKHVLDELNEPDFDLPKPLKFFSDGKSQNKENEKNLPNTQVKKRFVIDSDEESKDGDNNEQKKKKKFKRKKLEQRALQISDDEDDLEDEVEEDYFSDEIADDNEEERLVEYDSEENEVEIKPQAIKKKKKKASEFFEQEAELTSEDEWVGSGDEDEAGLDRMEREEGDDDTFHQGQLQRELGQIHMRDVLDQDKREVRLIQELLFEDGDLGGGGRQRKFRWRNLDGEEVTGTIPDELKDTQEEEFESEEQWRKQRHEREMFLRQMNNDGKEDEQNVNVDRNSIIKANLLSRTMSSLLEEVNQKTEETPKTAPTEKKTAKDIPSPAKKPFSIFQQSYHGSLLSRGGGALSRLAALAVPLVADDSAPLRPNTGKRNFVFAALTPDEEPKVTKRKADTNIGTPKLVKKMKTEEKQNSSKSSLLHFLKT